MRTHHFHASIEIDHPADAVWLIVSDHHRDPEWRTGVRTMTPSSPGPVAAGDTTLEVLRLGGRTYRSPGRVHEVGDRWFRWSADPKGPDSARGVRRVTPTGSASCRVDLDLEVDVRGVERALSFLLVPMLRKNLEGDARRLRSLASADVVVDAHA